MIYWLITHIHFDFKFYTIQILVELHAHIKIYDELKATQNVISNETSKL